MTETDEANSAQKRACGFYGINNGTCKAAIARWQGQIELRDDRSVPLVLRVCTAPSLDKMRRCGEEAQRNPAN